MGGDLEKFFVSLGIKGQDVVLKNIDKVKKQATSLSKIKSVIDLGKSNISKALGAVTKTPKMSITGAPPSAEQKKEDKQQKDNNKSFKDATKQFAGGAKDFTSSVASFDPTSVIKTSVSSLGEALSGISVLGVSLGQLPKGIADFGNSLVDLATGSLRMAKESAAGAYKLQTRNATTEYYGGGGLNRGQLSKQEHADLVMGVAGVYGKLQKPLLDVLNELVKEKDTAALERVASGNWASTGTTKGWILQQIESQTAGLPPEIAQKIQASLLANNKDLIQNKTEGQKYSQEINAGFANRAEAQTINLFGKTASQNKSFQKMDEDLNKMQVQLVNTGVAFSGSIMKAVTALETLPKTIENINQKIDASLRHAPSWMREGVGRLGK